MNGATTVQKLGHGVAVGDQVAFREGETPRRVTAIDFDPHPSFGLGTYRIASFADGSRSSLFDDHRVWVTPR